MKGLSKYCIIFYLIINSCNVYASKLFQFELGSEITEALKLKSIDELKGKLSTEMYGGKIKFMIYKSLWFKANSEYSYNYELSINSTTKRIWRVRYSIKFYTTKGVLYIFHWINEKIGKPSSGPFQIYGIDLSKEDSIGQFKTVGLYKYYLSWNCKLEPKYNKYFGIISMSTSTNNLCTEGVLTKVLDGNNYLLDISVDDVQVREGQ